MDKGSNVDNYSTLEEYQARLAVIQAKGQLRAKLIAKESERLSSTWEQVEAARSRTHSSAPSLAEPSEAREFFMQSMRDLAEVKKAVSAEMRNLANLLVLDLDASQSDVARQADVHDTTVHRWLDPERVKR